MVIQVSLADSKFQNSHCRGSFLTKKYKEKLTPNFVWLIPNEIWITTLYRHALFVWTFSVTQHPHLTTSTFVEGWRTLRFLIFKQNLKHMVAFTFTEYIYWEATSEILIYMTLQRFTTKSFSNMLIKNLVLGLFCFVFF